VQPAPRRPSIYAIRAVEAIRDLPFGRIAGSLGRLDSSHVFNYTS
jgi:hypothetical protein